MPESMHEIEKGNDTKPAPQDVTYPNMKKRILIMLSAYLAIFLITLVSPFYVSFISLLTSLLTNPYLGSKYYIHGHSSNHGRVPLHR